jgi:hypothetical protein
LRKRRGTGEIPCTLFAVLFPDLLRIRSRQRLFIVHRR